MTLAVGLLWTIAAAPVFSAGASTPLAGLLRGGVVADAGLVALLVLAAGSEVSLVGALKTYLLWLVLAVGLSLAAQVPRRGRNRHLAALGAALVLYVLSAGPFWANGLVLSAGSAAAGGLAWLVAALNPLLATLSSAQGAQGLVWLERPVAYELTVLGRDVHPSSVGWLVSPAFYALAAGLAGLACFLRRARLKRPGAA